jgi:hypothetical protein
MANHHTVTVLFFILLIALSVTLWMFYPHLRAALPDNAFTRIEETVPTHTDSQPTMKTADEIGSAEQERMQSVQTSHIFQNDRHFFIGRLPVGSSCDTLATMSMLSPNHQQATLFFSLSDGSTPCVPTTKNQERPFVFSFQASSTVSVTAFINDAKVPLEITPRDALPERW